MGLFGNKKEEEYEDEEGFSEEEEYRDRKLTRKFKDLNPENKRKRKEPPKPWGKSERLTVLIFFLITTLLATGMFLFSHDFKLPGLPKISFKNINMGNPFGEEIIQVGQKSSSIQNDAKAQKAITQFKNNIQPLSGFYGFLVVRLNDGINYGVSSDSQFQGASLLKLPLITLMYKMSEEGSLDLDTKYTLRETDKVRGSGVLFTQSAGTTYTYRKLAEYMGKNSDRTAYKVMKDVIGADKLKNYLNEIGMNSTNIETGMTTPNDFGLLFTKLWNGKLVGQTNRDEILGFLQNTIYENWITAGVPKNTKVAHKFGQDTKVIADGGIVLADKPYVLIIMSQGINENDASVIFPKISRDIYTIENDVQ
jgi:beta-lactamase class A